MENSMVASQRVKRKKHMIQQFWSCTQRKWKQGFSWCFYTQVLSSTIHNGHEVEATQVSSNRWIDKQNAVDPYTGILFSLKKKGHSDTWMNLGNSMLNKISQSQRTHIVWFYLDEVSTVKFIETESGMVVAGGWGKEEWGVSVSRV